MAIDLSLISPEDQARLDAALAVQEEILGKMTTKPERQFGEPPQPNPLTISITRVPSAADMAAKRKRVVEAVGRTNYLEGVQHPKVSPMGAAGSDQAQKNYAAQMAKSEVIKRRQDNLKGVTDNDWLGQIELTGADAYVSRTAATQYKFERFAQKYEPQLKAILAQADAMPTESLDQRIAKSAFIQKQLAGLKGKV